MIFVHCYIILSWCSSFEDSDAQWISKWLAGSNVINFVRHDKNVVKHSWSVVTGNRFGMRALPFCFVWIVQRLVYGLFGVEFAGKHKKSFESGRTKCTLRTEVNDDESKTNQDQTQGDIKCPWINGWEFCLDDLLTDFLQYILRLSCFLSVLAMAI